MDQSLGKVLVYTPFPCLQKSLCGPAALKVFFSKCFLLTSFFVLGLTLSDLIEKSRRQTRGAKRAYTYKACKSTRKSFRSKHLNVIFQVSHETFPKEKQHKQKLFGPVSRGHSWPFRPDAQGSKSFSPPPGPQENAVFGVNVHDFRCGRPWPERLSTNFVKKKHLHWFLDPKLKHFCGTIFRKMSCQFPLWIFWKYYRLNFLVHGKYPLTQNYYLRKIILK